MRLLAVAAAGGLLALTTAWASDSQLDALTGSNGSASVTAVGTSVPSSASASSAAPPSGTIRIVLRPVTTHGTAASGYTLSRHLDESVSCSGPATASRVAVNHDIDECGPSAAYPVACWPSATPHTTLCFRNPFARQVDLLSVTGSVPRTAAPATPAPFGLVLADGSRCTIRGGGAWAALDGHPGWYGTYGCAGDRYALWASGHGDGVNRSEAVWTVQQATADGHGTLRAVGVRTAYFVGTAG